jgi:hypothetical protein
VSDLVETAWGLYLDGADPRTVGEVTVTGLTEPQALEDFLRELLMSAWRGHEGSPDLRQRACWAQDVVAAAGRARA